MSALRDVSGQERAAVSALGVKIGAWICRQDAGSTLNPERRALPTRRRRSQGLFVFEDEADVAVAFGVGGFDPAQIIDQRVHAEVFMQVVFAQIVSAHSRFDYFAVAHD